MLSLPFPVIFFFWSFSWWPPSGNKLVERTRGLLKRKARRRRQLPPSSQRVVYAGCPFPDYLFVWYVSTATPPTTTPPPPTTTTTTAVVQISSTICYIPSHTVSNSLDTVVRDVESLGVLLHTVARVIEIFFSS